MADYHKLTSIEREFYLKVLKIFGTHKIPYLIGGSYAVMKYLNITRETKDLDIFCKAGDYPKVLKIMQDQGFGIQIEDERWIAKILKGKYFIDLIYTIPNTFTPIDEVCINRAVPDKLFGKKTGFISPEDLIWSKVFRMFRDRDNADVKNIILKQGKILDWKYLLQRMENQWEILFVHLLEFGYIYPSERGIIPSWLMNELIDRIKNQVAITTPEAQVCRGLLLSNTHYRVAFKEWGFLNATDRPDL